MVRSRLIILLLVLVGFYSCKKPTERACFKTAGKESVVEIPFLESIDSLTLYDNLIYLIIPSSENKVEISGSENLISFIDVSVNNGMMVIKDDNRCNFLRSYKNEIYVNIYANDIKFIEYLGSNSLKSKDTLLSNELRLYLKDGAGSVDLTLKNGYTSAIASNGYGDFVLAGETSILYLHCNSNTFCDTRAMKVEEKVTVRSNTVGNIWINADNAVLDVYIQYQGDVGYIGNPSSKKVKIDGKGSLINLNN